MTSLDCFVPRSSNDVNLMGDDGGVLGSGLLKKMRIGSSGTGGNRGGSDLRREVSRERRMEMLKSNVELRERIMMKTMSKIANASALSSSEISNFQRVTSMANNHPGSSSLSLFSSERKKEQYDLFTKLAAASKTNTSLSLSTDSKKRKRKKKKPMALDESCSIEKTDDDIIFGRGKLLSKHPGNICFREKALKLLPSYKQAPKGGKKDVTNLLIESMKGEGRRFLAKGDDKLWHEVVDVDGVFIKASQTFRDLKEF